MNMLYQQDSFILDAARITSEMDPIFGDMTVFHDVVIASEIVQPYNDGRAYKPRDELEKYAPYVNGRWVIVGAHPVDGIISERDQVSGRTVNARYVKNLLDSTKRPRRAGVRADVQIFNDKVPPKLLAEMKNGLKQDVSIGFFFNKDEVAGTVADGPFKGDEYDYIQRNMFHDHLAAGIDNGRCPSPLCGLGADEVKKLLIGDPFAGFPDYNTCVKKIMKEQGVSEESAKKICGKLKSQHEDNNVEDEQIMKAGKILRMLLEEELESLRGEKDAMKETKEWWMVLDWKDEKLAEIFNHLTEDIRTQIIDAGLCPDCGDEEEECEEGYEKNEEGECVKMEEEEDESLPYEDGDALEFTLTPVTDKGAEKLELDPYSVLQKADRVLSES